jgi:hypothetical protein
VQWGTTISTVLGELQNRSRPAVLVLVVQSQHSETRTNRHGIEQQVMTHLYSTRLTTHAVTRPFGEMVLSINHHHSV